MATRIRLQRHGKKRAAFYHIVVADSRVKRDGKYIERLGVYNPNTNPATIELNFDSAVDWVKKGAEPSDTARAILSYKGVMLKKHLDRGVEKGALKQEEADKKLQAWLEEKEGKIQAKRDKLAKEADDAAKKIFTDESEKRAAKAKEVMQKTSELAAATAAAEVQADSGETEEATSEVAEAATDAATDAPANEAAQTTEATAEEKTEEPAAEAKTEPAEEASKQEDTAAKAEQEEKSSEEAPKAEADSDKKEENAEAKEQEPAAETKEAEAKKEEKPEASTDEATTEKGEEKNEEAPAEENKEE